MACLPDRVFRTFEKFRRRGEVTVLKTIQIINNYFNIKTREENHLDSCLMIS